MVKNPDKFCAAVAASVNGVRFSKEKSGSLKSSRYWGALSPWIIATPASVSLGSITTCIWALSRAGVVGGLPYVSFWLNAVREKPTKEWSAGKQGINIWKVAASIDSLQLLMPLEDSEFHVVWGQPPFFGAPVLKTVFIKPGGHDPPP